jgi:hypothetical protein
MSESKARELLISGKLVLIDENMFEIVNKFTWHLIKNRKDFYAYTNMKIGGKNHLVSMHRLLTGFSSSIIDHKNRNTLDNRCSNLRFATRMQNSYNRVKINKHGYRGVFIPSNSKNYAFQIQANGKRISQYGFKTAEEAAKAYDKANKELHGEFGIRNFKD